MAHNQNKEKEVKVGLKSASVIRDFALVILFFIIHLHECVDNNIN